MNDLSNYLAFVLMTLWNIACCIVGIIIIEEFNEKKKK